MSLNDSIQQVYRARSQGGRGGGGSERSDEPPALIGHFAANGLSANIVFTRYFVCKIKLIKSSRLTT